ncbi:MAG: RsbRD N-terminal domain-containing protein [Desulfovibrio sp.]|nr:RsbRD N-terminal domain-containing protein [Desulfovibrio sp.]
MKLTKLLHEKHEELEALWVDAVFKTYSEKAIPHLSSNADPFTNPVGNMVKEAAHCLFSALSLDDITIDAVKQALDRFVKIRAVQDFTPSQSVGVIYLIKPLLRSHILPAVDQHQLSDYLDLESRVDTLALLAFDMYTKDRETVAQIRIKEIRNQYAQLKRWAQHFNAQAPLGTFTGCGNQGCK